MDKYHNYWSDISTAPLTGKAVRLLMRDGFGTFPFAPAGWDKKKTEVGQRKDGNRAYTNSYRVATYMRKPKIEPIGSRDFRVIIIYGEEENTEHTAWIEKRYWFVRNRETCASTNPSTDLEAYYALKRVWRKSKEDFESACRFMDFADLFSTGGVRLP